MSIPVTPGRQVLDLQIDNLPWFSAEISDVNDNQPLCHFRIQKGKNEVRAAEACINNLHGIGKREARQLLHDGRTEPVVREQGISTSCYYDFSECHLQNAHWMSFWATILLSSSTTIMWVAQETHGSYPRTMTSASCHGAPVRARLQVGKFQVVGTSIS